MIPDRAFDRNRQIGFMPRPLVHQVPVVIQGGDVHEVVGPTWLDHNATNVRNIWIEPTPTGSVLVAASGHHEKAGDWEFQMSFQSPQMVRDWLAKERFANAKVIDTVRTGAW